jgi:hypothetical protein
MKPECMPLIITVEERHNSGGIFKFLISVSFFFWDFASNLFLLNGLRAQSMVNPLVGLLSLTFKQARFWMEFPPFLMKQFYHCDLVVISSFVGTVYSTRRRIPKGRRNQMKPLNRLLDV